MNSFQKIAVVTIGLVASIGTEASADIIVKWGESGGDTGIVTANASGVNQFGTTYSDTSIGSPTNGTSGYANPSAGQTRTFYGAMSITNTVPIVNNSGSGDRIQMVNNFGGSAGTLQSMIAWQEGDFLTADRSLESMNVSFASRGGDGTNAFFLIETSAGWYRSTQSENSTGAFVTFSENAADLTWTAFSDFGVTGGAVAADINDIQSVGLSFESSNTSSNFVGGLVRNFEVNATAVPEPSSLTFLCAGAIGLFGFGYRRRNRNQVAKT